MDPPYNQRQYSANYHVLETIARYDNPILKGKTGMRDYSNQKSKYSNKREVKKAFEDLIMNADAKYIFLSYNNEGLMSFDEIKEAYAEDGSRCPYCTYRQITPFLPCYYAHKMRKLCRKSAELFAYKKVRRYGDRRTLVMLSDGIFHKQISIYN
mgnify:CR=1 FL=1